MVFLAPVASAAPAGPLVILSGSASCAKGVPAVKIRFQAANGEAKDVVVAGRKYSTTFYRVPAAGMRATGYVMCRGDSQFKHGKEFKITRHLDRKQEYENFLICRNGSCQKW
jgi:hypothetical protein